MKSCVIRMTKKKQNFGSLSNCRYRADRSQNLTGSAPNIWLTMLQIHPNRFTFGEVIAERAKAVLLARRVFPIFAFRRIISENPKRQMTAILKTINLHRPNSATA